jgi:hypothetical protein
MKKFFKRTSLFLLLPFLTIELILRVVPVFNGLYLEKIDPYLVLSEKDHNQVLIFVGSSRVAALIMPEKLNNHLSKSDIYSINAGRGMTTGMIHYLALQQLEKKGLLKNTTVFVEAPGGLCNYYENYKGNWVDDRNIHLIIPYLNTKTLCRFWKYSDNEISTKLAVTTEYFLYSFRIYSITKEMLKKNSIAELVNKISRKHNRKVENNELVERGGIKIDSLSIANARTLAIEDAKLEIQNQKLITLSDWDMSILKDMNTLLNRNNAKLVLFSMPLSSVQAQIYTTEIAKDNILTFREFLAVNKIQYLDVRFSDYTDADFPDLWHISMQKAEEYTLKLIDTWK